MRNRGHSTWNWKQECLHQASPISKDWNEEDLPHFPYAINMKTHRTDKLVIILLVLLSVILLTSGQVDVEDVTDLDAAAGDLNELLDALEGENIESSLGGVDDVDDKQDCDADIVDETPASEENIPVEKPTDESTLQQQAEEEVASTENTSETDVSEEPQQPPAQSGPFVDIFGDVLLSLEMVDETHAQVHQHFTNEALAGKKVVGLYFSAGAYRRCRFSACFCCFDAHFMRCFCSRLVWSMSSVHAGLGAILRQDEFAPW